MTAEDYRKFADRRLEWARQAKHAEVRDVYSDMAERWMREAAARDALETRQVRL